MLHHNGSARVLLSHYRPAAANFATILTVMRLCQTACALEAYFLDHQKYPESLEVLVPEFLPAVPRDLDNKPMRYAQDSASSRYKLWSVGVNGTDDGGVEKSETGRKPRPWREPVGDWVWRYP